MTVNLSHLASSLAKKGTVIDLKKKTVLEFTQPASYESQGPEAQVSDREFVSCALGDT